MTALTPARVLVVCTGNICRSPYIEHLLQGELDQVWGQGRVMVRSAGTHALAGQTIDPGSATALRARGQAAPDFRARHLLVADIAAADLVIAVTREHRSAVVRMSPTALRRTTTLAEVALAAPLVPAIRRDEGDLSAAVRTVAAAVVAHRPALVDIPPRTLDLNDPYRQEQEAYDRMARGVDRWLPGVVSALSPSDATEG